MKNLANLIDDSIEYIDNLPSRDKVRPPKDGRDHYKGEDYPWRKVYRFLVSRVGRPWDRVFSEYVHFDWIPRQYKTENQIAYSVLLNTFIKDGKVWYFDRGYFSGERPIEESCGGFYCHSEVFYVHPQTKLLCYYKPKKIDYKKRMAKEEAKTLRILGDYHQLVKIKGIWHEVKAEPVKSDIVVIDGLHYKESKYIPKSEPSVSEFFNVHGTGFRYRVIGGKVLIPVEGHWENENKIGPRDRLVDDDYKDSIWRRLDYHSVKITLYRQLNHKDLKKHGLKNDVKIVGKPCEVCGNVNCILDHHKNS
jgi:hypothetical protein